METLLQDLRYALRSFRRRPVFAAVAVATLALGIGANTAVFSVVDGVLLQPLPYRDAEELALIWTDFGPDLPQNWVSGPELVEMRELSTRFEEIGAVVPATVSVTGEGEPVQVGAAGASGNFFRILQVDAARGRLLTPEDDAPGANPVVVLGHGFWERRYGADPGIVGDTITVDREPRTVVGVLPEGFRIHHPDTQFPPRVDLWLPLVPFYDAPYAEWPRGSHGLRAFGRLHDGVTLEQARSEMDAVAAQMAEMSPDYYSFEGWGITVLSLHGDLVEEVRTPLLVLLGAVGFVLLIACANVANLQLTRAASREREIALRSALGASRGRLARQLLTESGVLGVVGGGLGLVSARWLVQALVDLAPEGLPLQEGIGIDASVLVFTVAITVTTVVLFGMAPYAFALRSSLVDSLKEGGRGATAGGASARTRSALVVVEVALALVLLVGAGLMIRTLNGLMAADPGYETEGVLTARIALSGDAYDGEAQRAFWDRMRQRAEAIPGVRSAGAISQLPLSGSYASGTTVVEESRAVKLDPRVPFPYIEADRRIVTPGYFRTMGIQLLKGRTFTEADNRDGSPVAVVDEEFVDRFWPAGEPLGKRVAVSWDDDRNPNWRTVVGVVRHSRHYDVSTVGREQIYTPVDQRPTGSMYLVLRASTDPHGLAGSLRREVRRLDPNQPVADVQTMAERVGEAVAQPRFNLSLLSAFAVLALVLAAVGIYGVISYAVGQRIHEIGVRMALGADRGDVRRLVLSQGMAPVGVGLALGILVALGLGRVMSSLLFEVTPTDPITYAVVSGVLALVSATACLVPALRATRVEPAEVLREE